ncbi:hypothetical protein AMECASPLE_028437 [Ameca splendens]|uniref:Secreted protein n=1 Tax=Ameca splendens TaxID=208324 RepID=A0ABV0XUD3_9TELE
MIHMALSFKSTPGSVLFLHLCSVLSNLQSVVADGCSRLAWFCWRFLPVKSARLHNPASCLDQMDPCYSD